MDNTTLTVVLTVVVGVVILNFLLGGEPSGQRTHPVTPQMVATVQQVAPQLSEDQIRYDLQRTGNVNVTIDRFLNEGTLPRPPESKPEKEVKKEAMVSLVGPFGGLSFEGKRRQLVEEGRKKLAEKAGVTWEELCRQSRV